MDAVLGEMRVLRGQYDRRVLDNRLKFQHTTKVGGHTHPDKASETRIWYEPCHTCWVSFSDPVNIEVVD